MNTNRTIGSEYMHWAKTRLHARFDLAVSGMPNVPLAALGASIDDLEITNTDAYGYAPLRQGIAARYGVAPGNVVAAAGTSMANHLAMAALVEADDEVIVERPVYEPIVATARYLGANVRFLERRFENGFVIDPDDVARLVSPRTRLVVLTNLHNPSGAMIDRESLAGIGAIAERFGAKVLVDEVYLDATFDDPQPAAVRLGPAFISTSSLTKLFGMSGLRCGWVLAEEGLADRMWRLNDLYGVNAAHAAERLSVVALQHADRLLDEARELIEANRAGWQAFAATREEISTAATAYGTTVFPRLAGCDADALVARLGERYETSVVPGRFFGAPEHIRIGLTVEPAVFREGLARLGEALGG
ncbi:MAG: aminotransferase class I/II-fold pyridoxal phosphate-dependent enzyme [Blastocatellia bacterium]|nr:aminotransferase class I/II-fold pyridoxal phosphate-dependent enzyme [Blastocatellia bacterium]